MGYESRISVQKTSIYKVESLSIDDNLRLINKFVWAKKSFDLKIYLKKYVI